MNNFKPMLAVKYNIKYILTNKKYLVQPKLDGVRVIIHVENDDVNFYSRNNLKLDSLNDKKSDFDNVPNGIYDGEVISDTFNKVMTQIHRKNNIDVTNLNICIFDFYSKDSYIDRLNFLNSIKFGGSTHVLNKYKICNNISEIMSCYEEYLKQNYEGIMIRDLDCGYKQGRNKYLLKHKPVNTIDLKVMHLVEGTGLMSGMLGSITCKYKNNTINVGSGFTIEQRQEIWNNKQNYINKTCEILFQEETSNQNNTKSLRFPIFKNWRFDK